MGFVLLFVSVELLDWVLQLGRLQPVGYWTVLGGLGLAAASNAKHLPKLKGDLDGVEPKGSLTDVSDQSIAQSNVSQVSPPKASSSEPQLEPEPSTGAIAHKSSAERIDRSEDSISFRVRWPWR